MRDVNRIRPLLEKIYSHWVLHPDLRLGQMLYDVVSSIGYSDVFYIEDDKLSAAIDLFFDFDNCKKDNDNDLN